MLASAKTAGIPSASPDRYASGTSRPKKRTTLIGQKLKERNAPRKNAVSQFLRAGQLAIRWCTRSNTSGHFMGGMSPSIQTPARISTGASRRSPYCWKKMAVSRVFRPNQTIANARPV